MSRKKKTFPKRVPSSLNSSGNTDPSASIFSGAGITDHQALFSYSANWEAPGRWGVEVLTRKHRLIFRPLEKLKIQKIDSFERLCVSIDDKLDIKYKPGIYEQTKAFLSRAAAA